MHDAAKGIEENQVAVDYNSFAREKYYWFTSNQWEVVQLFTRRTRAP